MTKKAQILRNPLISLALMAAFPAAWADDAATRAVPVHGAVTAPLHRKLDLRMPDIRDVMSADELNTPFLNPDEAEFTGPETVQVHGAPPPPFVPGGFEALWWGATHPAQAWRILAPAQ
ncbi:MAG: hypothetical protein JWN85_3521 [Gammaproteobacteria bacterium]|nr:hypothetical protein [Gammaproteobacteria bacterium]